MEDGSGITSRAITNIDLIDLKCFAVTANTAYRCFAAVKLKCIEMWAANISALPNTLVCEYFTNNANIGSTSKAFSDTALGVSNIAHVKAKPPRDSFSSEWLPITAANDYIVANLTCPEGTIVDVTVVFQLIDTENSTAVTGALVGASPGKFYGRPLDSTQATPVFLPIGVDYI